MRYREACKLKLGDRVVVKRTGEVRVVRSIAVDGGNKPWMNIWTCDKGFKQWRLVLYLHDEVMK